MWEFSRNTLDQVSGQVMAKPLKKKRRKVPKVWRKIVLKKLLDVNYAL